MSGSRFRHCRINKVQNGSPIRRAWFVPIAAIIVLSFSSAGRAGILYSVTYENNRINALDADTGTLLISHTPPGPAELHGRAALAANGGNLYFSTLDIPAVYVIAVQTGSIVDGFPMPAGIDALGYGAINTLGPTLFALEDSENRVYLLNALSGAIVASYITSFDAIGALDFNSATGMLYVGDSSGVIRTVDPKTGAELNSFATTTVHAGIGFVSGRLFTASPFDRPPLNVSIVERNPITGAIIRSFPSIGGRVGALAGVSISPFFPGDANGDHLVDFDDLGILLNNYNQAGTIPTGDFDASGIADFIDLGILLNNYNQRVPVLSATVSVPEPSTDALAAFGTLGLLVAARRKLLRR